MPEIFRNILNQDELTLVEFINVNCEPCAMIEPTLQQVKNSVGKRLNVFVVNIEDVPEIVKEFSISTVPSLVLFQNGEIHWKSDKVLSKQEILEAVLNKI